MRDESLAAVVALLGPPRGRRVVQVSDLHNRLAAFRLAASLCSLLQPALLINTGDLSGLGRPLEAVLLRGVAAPACPVVFSPGNHDSEVTSREMRRRGAVVLDAPTLVSVEGVRVWGYRDPLRTVLFGSAPREGPMDAPVGEPPPADPPYLIALHRADMVQRMPEGVSLVLSGHVHTPEVRSQAGVLLVRPGAAGGDNPWSGPLRAAVIDLEMPAHRPAGVWLIEFLGAAYRVQEYAADGRLLTDRGGP